MEGGESTVVGSSPFFVIRSGLTENQGLFRVKLMRTSENPGDIR